jgi:hypothetical protein
MIPMRLEPMIYPVSADGMRVEDPETGDPFEGNELGWIDPRALDPDGNLLSEMRPAVRTQRANAAGTVHHSRKSPAGAKQLLDGTHRGNAAVISA